jgi:pilus assembly protein CpaF
MGDFFSEATAGFFRPIEPFLSNPEVTEVMVNGYQEIFIEQKGKILRTDSHFEDEEQLMAAVRRVAQAVGRVVDEKNPTLDARLPDGSRVHVVLPPAARRGIYLCIRKFAKTMLSLKQLVDANVMSVPMAKFLNLSVALAKNLVVSGGTSSGKTTLLNVISTLIPPDQRVIVIEDAGELQLQQEHVLPMETRPGDVDGKGKLTMRDLLKSSLRMRPDRIVIGEVRGGEAFDLLQAMNTGHSGCMATVHANTPGDALTRLETLALMADVELPWRAMRSQVSSALDIVVQTSRLRDGSRKITHISEVVGLTEAGEYEVNDIFLHQIDSVDEEGHIHGKHAPTGKLPTFLAEAKAQGYTVDETLFRPSRKNPPA